MTRFAFILFIVSVYVTLAAQPVWEQDLAVRQGVNLDCLESYETYMGAHWIFPARDGQNIAFWTATQDGSRHIMCTRLSQDGQRVWPEQSVLTHIPAIMPVDLLVLPDEGYALVWRHLEYKDGPYQAWVLFLNENGQPQGESIPLLEEGYDYVQQLYSWTAANGDVLVATDQVSDDGDYAFTLVRVTQEGEVSYESMALPNTAGYYCLDYANIGDILFILYRDNTLDYTYLQRFEPGVGYTWENAQPWTDIYIGARAKLFSNDDEGAYYIGYNNDSTILKRIDTDGAVVWTDSLEVCCMSLANPSSLAAGCLLVNINSPYYTARLYGPAGNVMWQVDLEYDPEAGNDGLYWYAHDDGESWIVDRRGVYEDGTVCYLHHILADGSLEYGVDGCYVMVENCRRRLLPALNGESVSLFNITTEDDSKYLEVESWLHGQQIVPQAAQNIDGGIDGSSRLVAGGLIEPGYSNFFAVWQTSAADYQSGSYYYLQTYDANGNTLLEDNGHVLLSGDVSMHYIDPQFLNLGDGRMYLLYRQDDAIKLKVFNSEGVTQGEDRILIDDTEDFIRVSATMRGDILRLAWTEVDDDQWATILYVQEFDDDNGALWSEPWSSTFSNDYNLYDVSADGDYISFRLYSDSRRVVRVVDGETAAGWPDEGLPIAVATSNVDIQTTEWNGDLYILKYASDEQWDQRLLKVTPDGYLSWGEEGVDIDDNTTHYAYLNNIIGSNAIYCMRAQDDGIYAVRIEADGSMPWGASGIQLAACAPEPSDRLVSTLLDNGAIACTWQTYDDPGVNYSDDIMFAVFDENGSVFTAAEGSVLAVNRWSQQTPYVSQYQGDIFAVWNDERNSNNYYEDQVTDIYAQRIGLNMVGAGEEDIPAPSLAMTSYPNPFNPETTVRFSLSSDGDVTLAVYNIRGQKVTTLVDGPMEQGDHEIVWRAEGQASGVYLLRLSSGESEQTLKALLLK